MLDRPSQGGAFTVLVFHPVVFLTLIHSCRGQSEVIGPSQPIVAFIGEDVILPCYLVPAMNAFDVTMEWARPDLDPRFVLVWRDGGELDSFKHLSYRGRTSLFTEELKHGNVSLKLSKVKISDVGTYRCFIPVLEKSATVQLVVGAVSPPVIQSSKNLSAGVLQCESEGWYPEPEVLWLDGDGNLLSAGATETLRGPDGLYTVSSRVAVEKRHGNFTCRVQQQNINQTRETHLYVPDELFMVPSSASTPSTAGSPGVIAGSVIGCVLLMSTAGVVFVVWKWRQKKFKCKRRSPEDGDEHTEEGKKLTSKCDNTGFQILNEREGENAPLMAAREEENNVIRTEDEDKDKDGAQSEHKNETQQNQTKPDVDRAEGERDVTSIKNENVPLISTEVEKHQKGRRYRKGRTRGKRQLKQEKELNVSQKQTGKKKRRHQGDSEPTQKRLKKPKEHNGAEIKSEEEVYMEQDIIDTEKMEVTLQQDQAFMCQEDQEEDMDL
ncbi:butyrophilin subfamily 3 member A2-like [Etheostoma cragini]|uniref:butyrophilin subfamily 3 member A2-like n=1 Tax=Etheostoma cragini TaxID=417921 RepID=UPI00155F19CD|nr:butyrophilin subfamily 3 member A2-like [Etheostoma cragini]